MEWEIKLPSGTVKFTVPDNLMEASKKLYASEQDAVKALVRQYKIEYQALIRDRGRKDLLPPGEQKLPAPVRGVEPISEAEIASLSKNDLLRLLKDRGLVK